MKLGIWALLGVLAVNPVIATATPNDPNPCGNHGNNCCTEDGGQSFVSVEDTCTQVVNANPTAYCSSFAGALAAAVSESRANAICGDATANCNGGTAFSLAVLKQTCTQVGIQVSEMYQKQHQSQESVNGANASCESAAQTCGDTAVTCGDTAQTCNLTCPVCPDVTVGTRVIKCKKYITRKDGRVVRKGCLVVTDAYPTYND